MEERPEANKESVAVAREVFEVMPATSFMSAAFCGTERDL
jgi:hypothetical protein